MYATDALITVCVWLWYIACISVIAELLLFYYYIVICRGLDVAFGIVARANAIIITNDLINNLAKLCGLVL